MSNVSTFKNDTTGEQSDHSVFLQSTLALVSLLFIFGVPPNFLSILFIFKAHGKRSTTTCLLLSLALADIVNLIGSLAVAILLYLAGEPLNVENPALSLNMVPKCVANFTLAILALERYNALVKVMRPIQILSNKHSTFLMLLTAWLISFAFYVPITALIWLKRLKTNEIDIYFICCLFLSFFLPLFICLFCYGAILKGIFYNGTILGVKITNKAEFRDRKRTVRILVVITVVFICCNFPTIVLKLLKVTAVKVFVKDFALTVMFILSCLSSMVNPYIYGLQSERYRQRMKQIMRLTLNKTQSHNITSQVMEVI